MARSAYELSVRSVLLVALGLPSASVIFLDEAGPRLKGEFATISVRPPKQVGSSVHTMIEGPPEKTVIRTLYHGSAEVQIFGDNQRDLALDLSARLERDPAVASEEGVQSVSLSPRAGIDPSEIAPFKDTAFDRRTVVELSYTFTHSLEVATEAIETLELTNNI